MASESAANDVIERLRGAANYEFGNLTPDQKNLYRAAADAIEAAHALLHGAEVDHDSLERALRACAAAAGMPDPADGCRNVIRIVKEAVGDVPF